MSDDPAPADTVRRLMREAWRAVLATELADEGGAWPYASLVLVACDTDLSPLLLLSDLAAHSANLRRTPRASILFDGTLGLDEPLAGPRATVVGRIEPMEDAQAKDRYVRRHAGAGAYATFGDFRLWRMRPERAHLVGGFGRIRWVDAGDFMSAPDASRAIAGAETALIEVLNREKAGELDALGGRLAGGSDWRLVGLDPGGVDLRRADGALARALFSAEAAGAETIRPAVEALFG